MITKILLKCYALSILIIIVVVICYPPSYVNRWVYETMKFKCTHTHSAKGRTNIELREQFILADGVSQSMAVFTPRRSVPNAAQNGNSNTPPYMSSQGPIIKVNSYEYEPIIHQLNTN